MKTARTGNPALMGPPCKLVLLKPQEQGGEQDKKPQRQSDRVWSGHD
jgi:hypothetical protein